ncbi:aldose epimerase family protein [Lacticaseibacillus absianus]|uniref:aldose epimerase family protein n=1 Tax=Lacticaseibacillus absianus TaxID=2729623 RepID=UPI0015CE448E|nr:aldose epimerase family protein [Lacticaseibacillus absianus]
MNRITVDKYQRRANHDYCEITLTNRNGMVVRLLNHGATIERVLLPDGHSGHHDAVMHLAHREDYDRERNFLGGTVGRIIGRMAAGEWTVGTSTQTFDLNDGPNHAHGGPAGFDTQCFDFTLAQTDRDATVTMTLFDPAGHNGYPGNLQLTASFTLDDTDVLTYRLDAVADALTPCNPANHVYFNLGDGTIEDHVLTLDASQYLPLAADSIPHDGAASVQGTVFDLREGQRLGDVLGSSDPQITSQNGLNHPFLLDGHAVAATLSLPGTGRRVTLRTTAPSVVVYTANHFDHTGYARDLGRYDGVALEAQFPPSADPSLSPILLMPGEHFNAQTSWQFGY